MSLSQMPNGTRIELEPHVWVYVDDRKAEVKFESFVTLGTVRMRMAQTNGHILDVYYPNDNMLVDKPRMIMKYDEMILRPGLKYRLRKPVVIKQCSFLCCLCGWNEVDDCFCQC